MKRSRKRLLLYFLIALSIVSLLSSIYLVQNHLKESSKPAACDLSTKVSCTTVNTSEYSKFLNTPVSAFGIAWSLILGALVIMSLKKKEHLATLVLWSFIGSVVALYFIWAEIQVGAICPFCTVVHGITFFSLGSSLLMFKGHKQEFQWRDFIKVASPWLLSASIMVAITLIYFNV